MNFGTGSAPRVASSARKAAVRPIDAFASCAPCAPIAIAALSSDAGSCAGARCGGRGKRVSADGLATLPAAVSVDSSTVTVVFDARKIRVTGLCRTRSDRRARPLSGVWESGVVGWVCGCGCCCDEVAALSRLGRREVSGGKRKFIESSEACSGAAREKRECGVGRRV
ncbi:hypothetical protein [Paraburkholderia graminis]|uniref:hypothetical protein n=1 Tax=Paraburkholderia graminis TaxID=60548 RepID=UPI001E2B258A|nr:hypothetical protein [Paraburkholderia graminis]